MNRIFIVVLAGMVVSSCVIENVVESNDFNDAEAVKVSVREVQEEGVRSLTVSDAQVFEYAFAKICVEAMAYLAEPGHYVKINSIRIGSENAGENFYVSGIFDFSTGEWSDRVCDISDPLTFTLDSTCFNSFAERLTADYEYVTDEEAFVKAIPQDFSETGFPVEVDFTIMGGESVILNDMLKTRVYPKLRPGRTCYITLDLTPTPITFNPSVAPWETD